MAALRKSKAAIDLGALLCPVASKLHAPAGVILGSPREASALVHAAALPDTACWQVDLYQADRLREELAALSVSAQVVVLPDLWDMPKPARTLLWPVSLGGERSLKLDVIEQAFHALAPGGCLIVLSPYEQDNLMPVALKKVFHRVHVPAGVGNSVFWCRREGDRPRRRHEMTFHVRSDDATSLRFLSRPGVFSYGRLDHGARALVESAVVRPGDRVADLGCGCGTNGIVAGHRGGPDVTVAFIDSNVRALALAELNAKAAGLRDFSTHATADITGIPEDSFDVVLANPPYYAQSSIARLFIQRGKALLKEAGRFYVVTKMRDETAVLMGEYFGNAEVCEKRGYFIFHAAKE